MTVPTVTPKIAAAGGHCKSKKATLRQLLYIAIPITIGSAGAALVEDGRFVLSPSVPGVKAIDPTAAGDSFVGAFCVAVCSGLSSEDALRFANHTAALTVSRLGAMPSLPTLAEVAATMPGGVSGLEG